MRDIKFYDLLTELERLINDNPTSENTGRLTDLLKNDVLKEYACNKLNKVEWLKELNKIGFFNNLPPALKDDMKNTLTFPVCPESRYLARMAKIAPEDVLQIILRIPDTDNILIHENFIEAAIVMPAELAVKISNKVKTWIESQQGMLFAVKYGKFISHLAMGNKIEEAISIADSLLQIMPDPKWEEKSKSESSFLTIKPVTRIDVWNYEQVLNKNIPDLVNAAKEKALILLCDKLEKAVKFSMRKSEGNIPDDHSYIWRPTIESDKNLFEGLRNLLVTAVRKAGESLIETNGKIILDTIEKYPYDILKRIGLYLRRKYFSVDPEGTNKLITHPKIFDSINFHHEYFHLLKERFNELSPDAKDGYLALVDKGEDISWWISIREKADGKKPSQEEIDKRRGYWQYTKLIPIQEYLTGDWRKKFDELKKEFPEPEHPDYYFYSGGGVRFGPTSPKSQQELSAITNEALIEFLKSWQPKDDWDEPEPEGLSRELTSLIKSDPERYALIADKFIGLGPTYISGLMRGFNDASRDKKNFEWQKVLELCDWVIKQPREIPNRPRARPLHSDPDWGWSRRAIASLLSTALNSNHFEIPYIYRELVWKILHPLTEDIEPTTERDKEPSMDPFTTAINTVRGEAMNATIEYALWVIRNAEKSTNTQQNAYSFKDMPEVQRVLEQHLDVGQDSSLAVRSVYGRWFPWLVLLDPQWAKDNVNKIFPKEPDKIDYYNAAWNTYIIFCSAYDKVFDLLKEEYKLAIERIGTIEKTPQMLRDINERLAEHLAVMCWRGKLNTNESNGLLELFYEKASEKLLARTIWYIGNILYNEKETIPSDILERLKAFWEWRKKDNKRPISNSERKEFGLWFASGKFDDDWSIKQLKEVLNNVGDVDSSHMVSEHILDIASIMPFDAIECLHIVVEKSKDNFEFYGWQKNARSIISAVLNSDNENAKELAIETIHILGARGYLEYRDLLPK
jgi:hypothetical protein